MKTQELIDSALKRLVDDIIINDQSVTVFLSNGTYVKYLLTDLTLTDN
jgi:hypothetical protein